jgi:hypothetical protein
MVMTNSTLTFLAEAACAASSIVAHAPVAGERMTDNVPALVERCAT